MNNECGDIFLTEDELLYFLCNLDEKTINCFSTSVIGSPISVIRSGALCFWKKIIFSIFGLTITEPIEFGLL